METDKLDMTIKSEKIKSAAVELATHSNYLTIIPKLVELIQRHFGKKIPSTDKHQLVVLLAQELFPNSYANDSIVSDVINLTFFLARSVEMRRLLKRSCNCF